MFRLAVSPESRSVCTGLDGSFEVRTNQELYMELWALRPCDVLDCQAGVMSYESNIYEGVPSQHA